MSGGGVFARKTPTGYSCVVHEKVSQASIECWNHQGNLAVHPLEKADDVLGLGLGLPTPSDRFSRPAVPFETSLSGSIIQGGMQVCLMSSKQ